MEQVLIYIAAIFGTVLMVLLWILIQFRWRKIFHDHLTDQDVLAGRRSCGNCGCKTACELKKTNSEP